MAEPAWLEISLLVNGELAEAVAEVLSRYIDGGIVIENTKMDKRHNPVEEKVRVFGYLPVNHRLEETRKKISEALWHLGQIQPLPKSSHTFIEESNWMESWKQHYRPIEVGERFLILPAWVSPQPNNKRLAIQIEPGMAFGTGTHPTTQLSLELLEHWQHPGDRVIDVGCGSGILSIAAAKLGAESVLAVDVDEKAITLTEESVQLNQVGGVVKIGFGSVADILEGRFPFNQASVVVVNILSRVLRQLIKDDIGKLVSERGTLIFSGILEEEEEEIVMALGKSGFHIVERMGRQDWVGLAGQRG